MKAGLAYADSFNIETNYDGTRYIYNMYEAEEGTKLDLLISMPTQEPNGTTFAIKLHSNSDYGEFLKKIKEQLSYFEGVYFDVVSQYGSVNINNDFKIITSENWKYSQLNQDDNMHLCLDNVYYPIDYNKLGISPISVPIALNFKTSEGIIPVPNRESIKYTPSVRELILNKIKLISEQFVTEYNEKASDVDNIFKIWNDLGATSRMHTIEEVGNFEIKELEKFSDVKFKKLSVKGIQELDLLYVKNNCGGDLMSPFHNRGGINYGRKFNGNAETSKIGYLTNKDNANTIICTKERPTKVMLDYIKFAYKDQWVYFVGHVDRTRSLKHYKSLLRLTIQNKSLWRTLIKEYQLIEDSVFPLFTDIESITPTAEWLAERKANRAKSVRTNVSKEEINPKVLSSTNRGTWNTSGTKVGKMMVCELKKQKGIHLYFNENLDGEERRKIDSLFNIFNGRERKIYALSDRDYKKLENEKIHNWIKTEHFMNGDAQQRAFGDYCTKYVVSKIISKYPKIFELKDIIKTLSVDFFTKMDTLNKYAQDRYYVSNASGDVMDYMLKICEEKKLWNQGILDLSKEIEAKIGVFDFLEHLKGVDRYQSKLTPVLEKIAVELLKSRRFKLNLELYDLPLNEEVTIVEEVAEVAEEDEF